MNDHHYRPARGGRVEAACTAALAESTCRRCPDFRLLQPFPARRPSNGCQYHGRFGSIAAEFVGVELCIYKRIDENELHLVRTTPLALRQKGMGKPLCRFFRPNSRGSMNLDSASSSALFIGQPPRTNLVIGCRLLVL
ncbi:MAG: hypothetical protein R2795_24305 [Saprospiraceae bacterium]